MSKLKDQAKRLKTEIGTLYYAYKDPETPIYAKLGALLVVSYALSPIDLIPDFIPVLGYLDDIILLPLGIWLVLKLIPEPIISRSREESLKFFLKDKKSNRLMAALIIALWLFVILVIIKAAVT